MSSTIEEIATLSGHSDRAWCVTWSPTSSVLASCSTDKTVRLYGYSPSSSTSASTPSSAPPKFNLVTSIATGHARTLRTIAFSPNGKTLATASFDATVGIWERTDEEQGGDGDWECVSTLEGHDSECKSVAWSASGSLLASCSRDKSVWVWEVQPDADFECLSVLMEHTQDVKCVAWHPHEEILASASYDDTILLLSDDPQSDWSPFQTLKSHSSTVWTLAFSPCGRWLASAGDGGEIRLWQRSGQSTEALWKEVLCGKDAHSRTIYSLSWSPSNTPATSNGVGRLASTGGDGRLCIWQVACPADLSAPPTLTLVAERVDAHGVSDVNSVCWCPPRGQEEEEEIKTREGKTMLATGGDDGLVRVWWI